MLGKMHQFKDERIILIWIAKQNIFYNSEYGKMLRNRIFFVKRHTLIYRYEFLKLFKKWILKIIILCKSTTISITEKSNIKNPIYLEYKIYYMCIARTSVMHLNYCTVFKLQNLM